MKLINLLITMFLLFCCSMSMAEEWKNPDLQTPGARQDAARTTRQIKNETPVMVPGEAGLETHWFCDMQHSYDDKGSGGEQDVKFFMPVVPAGYSILGGYAQGNHYHANGCVLGVRPVNRESNVLLRAPANWQRIWTDKNSGAYMDGSIWHPQADRADYVCLGSIARQGYNIPYLPNYACVHQCLVEEVPVTGYIWSDRGTGASRDVSIYKLHNSNVFFAVPSHSPPKSLLDLRRNPVCRSVN